MNPTARRKLRNGGAGVPQDPGSERMERGGLLGEVAGGSSSLLFEGP